MTRHLIIIISPVFGNFPEAGFFGFLSARLNFFPNDGIILRNLRSGNDRWEVYRLAKKKNKKVVRYRRPLNINVGMIIFALIFLYMAFYLYTYLRRDKVEFYEVVEGSIVNDTRQDHSPDGGAEIYGPCRKHQLLYA